jgi:cytochrome c5
MYACSPKTSKSTAVTTSTAPSAPTDEQMVAAAQSKYPNTTLENFKKGHDLYYGACTKCHNPKNIAHLQEAEIPSIVNSMAHKAKISEEEKNAVLQYIMGVKLTGK